MKHIIIDFKDFKNLPVVVTRLALLKVGELPPAGLSLSTIYDAL